MVMVIGTQGLYPHAQRIADYHAVGVAGTREELGYCVDNPEADEFDLDPVVRVKRKMPKAVPLKKVVRKEN